MTRLEQLKKYLEDLLKSTTDKAERIGIEKALDAVELYSII